MISVCISKFTLHKGANSLLFDYETRLLFIGLRIEPFPQHLLIFLPNYTVLVGESFLF